MSVKSERILKWVLVAALVIALIPLVTASFYYRPVADDLFITYEGLQAWKSSNILETLHIYFDEVVHVYNTHNGCFFSTFLDRVSPMIVDYRLAWIHPIFILLFLIFSCMRFSVCIVNIAGGIRKDSAYCIGLFTALLMIVLMPYLSEGIYWYDAALKYTGMFSLALLLCSAVLELCFSSITPAITLKEKGHIRIICKLMLLCIGFFLFGGAYYQATTIVIAAYGLLAIYVIIQMKEKWYVLIPFIFLIIGFCIAILSPGNMLRHDEQLAGIQSSLSKAFIFSFLRSVIYCITIPDWRFYLLFLIFLPVVASILHQQSNLTYQHPFLLLAMSICVQAANLFPGYYVYDGMGLGRMLNIDFYLFCLLFPINFIYISGYLRCKIAGYRAAHGKQEIKLFTFGNKVLTLFITGVFIIFGLFSIKVEVQDGEQNVLGKTAPTLALTELLDGSLLRFAKEYDDLVELVRSHPNEDIIVHYYPQTPRTLYPFYLDQNKEDYQNSSFALLYGCKSISYIPELSTN